MSSKDQTKPKHVLAPGIYHFQTGPFNWYVAEEAGRLTLIDAGFPGHYGVFLQGLKLIGKTVADLEAIILTHAHADHTGFADRLRRETGKPVYIHKADMDFAKQRLMLPWFGLLSNAWRTHIAKMLLIATWNGVFMAPRIGKLLSMKDGQILDVPGRPVVIHTPGHTPGEVSFHFPKQKVLITGDSLVTLDLFSGLNVFPTTTPYALNDNLTEARKSIERFKGLGELLVLPGHGKPWKGDIEQVIFQVQHLVIGNQTGY